MLHAGNSAAYAPIPTRKPKQVLAKKNKLLLRSARRHHPEGADNPFTFDEGVHMAQPMRVLIDTHCHLTTPEILRDISAVAERAGAAGVTRAICVTTSPPDTRNAMNALLAQRWIWLAAGIHPHEAAKVSDADLEWLRNLHLLGPQNEQMNERIVAVGETGLDFHYDFAPPDVQERVFRSQLALAVEAKQPVIIHARKAEEQVCDILRDYPALHSRVVFHCYSGPAAAARRILDEGYWLSFTGIVTFRNAEELRQVACFCPADRLMVETDAPYLTPEPHRKVWPNEPAYAAVTARFLAKLRGVDYGEFVQQTTANAERFFRLPKGE